jgi:hypothetical protein
MLAAWPDPTPADLAIVMVLGTALYGLPALRVLWRPQGTMVEAAEIAALGLAGLIVPMMHFHRADGSNDLALALISLAAALLPAGAAALGWTNPVRRDDARFALLVTTAAVLVAAAAALALPDWSLAPLFGLLGLGLLALSLQAEDLRLEASAWAITAIALSLLALGFQSEAEFDRLFGLREGIELNIALVRWAGLAAIFALFAWKGRSTVGRDLAQAVAALLAYGAIAQFPLGDAQPLAPALGLAALAQWSRRLAPDALLQALATLLTVSLLWAAPPLLNWTVEAVSSLFGYPMLVTNLPELREVILRLLIPALLIALAWRLTDSHLLRIARLIALILASIMGAVALHVLFKQLWSMGTMEEFVRFGLAERISWEALLLGAALLAWRFDRPRIAIGLTAAGLAHFAWYTLLVHNPLLSAQAVGPRPIVNVLLPAYGLPLIWLWLISRRQPALPATLERIRSAAPMLLIILFAFSSLRQLFHGSILTDPGVTAGEDIFRSILAILLAIGFLIWGISRGSRDWRIASLVMMIAAVAKVFLLDASGLDGLLRIGSFVALGLSLIGLGWLYSRYLGEDRQNRPEGNAGRTAAYL